MFCKIDFENMNHTETEIVKRKKEKNFCSDFSSKIISQKLRLQKMYF